jgi:hypothetical protein
MIRNLSVVVPAFSAVSPFDGPPDAFGGSGLGLLLHRTLNVMKVAYSVAVNAGAVGNTALYDDLGNAAVLPPGSVVVRSFSNWTTAALAAGGAATGAFSVATAGAADLLAATAKASLTGLLEGTPTGSAASMIALGAAATGYRIYITIATNALTVGVASLYVFYVF